MDKRKKELGFSNLEYAILLFLEEKLPFKNLVEDVKEIGQKLDEDMFSSWQFQASAKKAADKEVRLFLRKYVKEGLSLGELEELHGKIMDRVVSYAQN